MNSPPEIVAVELPFVLREPILRALPHAEQIPFISIQAGDPQDKLHFILEPLEPLVEAIRSAYEMNIACHFIDSFSELFQIGIPYNFPDTYVLNYMSPVELYKIYLQNKNKQETATLSQIVNHIDNIREIHMASRIRSLLRLNGSDGNLLVLCGMKHVEGLKNFLSLSESEFEELYARREGLLSGFEEVTTGRNIEEEEPLETLLNQINQDESSLNGINWEISFLSRHSPEVLEQPAFLNTAWNLVRKNKARLDKFNRVFLLRAAYREAVNRYEKESGELVPPQREKLFFRFARNWSIVEKSLLPNAYKMIMAARGFGGDNFARIMYDTLNYLPVLRNAAFPEKKLTLNELHRDSRLIRFRLKYKLKRKVPPPKIIKRYKKEKYPGEWQNAWNSGGICSYPPEDIKIEDFGRYLQKRTQALLQGSENKVVPFSSSLLDGLDYRETIRNLHQGKIFVKEINIRGLEVGSVVVIFSEDDNEHNWKVVWWGEHDQESDMAFYSTGPGVHMAGPGICRCIYGGFMLTYPPGRLHDIWTDRFYGEFQKNSADQLLAAALEYNEKNTVIHLSDRSPNHQLQQIAGKLGQKIIHIPLSTINSVLLGRIRRFHVLDSKERRDESGDYIW